MALDPQTPQATQHPVAFKSTPIWVFVVVVLAGVTAGAVIVFGACALWRWYQRRSKVRLDSIEFYDPFPRMLQTSPLTSASTDSLNNLGMRSPLSTIPEFPQPPLTQLEPRLYKSVSEEDFPGSPFMGPSRLCFSLNYCRYTERLRVKLLRATRLTPRGNNVTTTPYVKIYLLPDKKRKVQSRIRQRTSNPDFNEDFVFAVPPEELCLRTLRFTVCDFDRFSRQQVIGHVHYGLTDIENIMTEEGTGEIWLDINEDNARVIGGVEKGQLLISLQFLPTASRLTVAILKARDLKLEEEPSDIDPYVKVSMIMGGKSVKKRKTAVCKKTCNPVYNEAFVFSIPPTCLDRVSFVVSVVASPKLGGNKRLIGRAVMGPYMYSTGAGLAHWNDMLSSPRSAVAQWHPLI